MTRPDPSPQPISAQTGAQKGAQASNPAPPPDDTAADTGGHRAPDPISEHASVDYLALTQLTRPELEQAFVRGVTPDLDALVGWTFRGTNTPRWASLAGIKKFCKGFYRRAGTRDVYGYNVPVVQNRLGEPWIVKHKAGEPARFGFYRVDHVDPTARDNAYLHAVLLDYGRGRNPLLDPSRGLRDYLVQVERDNPDIYLGKAYFAVGPLRTPGISFFVLERLAPGPTELDR